MSALAVLCSWLSALCARRLAERPIPYALADDPGPALDDVAPAPSPLCVASRDADGDWLARVLPRLWSGGEFAILVDPGSGDRIPVFFEPSGQVRPEVPS